MKEEVKNIIPKSNIKWFSELSINSKEIAGSKASYLSEAYNKNNFSKNVNIPAGFVITKDAIESFFEVGNIKNAVENIFNETDKNNNDELKSASNKIKNLIMKTQFPSKIKEEIFEAYENLGDDDLEIGEGLAYDILSNATEPAFVAVRASYRNELGDSYFNIKGKSNIIYSIKKIISSLFNADIIFKEINSGVAPKDIITAIIIQKMVQADKSGIVYSGNTITTNAIWGLGGGLKLDEVQSDKYLAERSFRVISKEIGEKKYAITRESSGSLKLIGLKEGYSFMQVLEEHEVQELCNILLRLDDIFGEKVQFEFAMVEGEISIVKISKVDEKKVVVVNEVKEIAISEMETIDPVLANTATEIETEDAIILDPVIIEEEVVGKNSSTQEEVKEIITQTNIDVLIKNNTLGENANPTSARSGLLTLENIIKDRGIHPNNYIENFNTKGYGEVIFNGLQMNVANLNEIWVSLSDFTNEEFKDLKGAKEEHIINPIMGLNGIRYLLTNPELLKRELKAISKLANENNNVGVIIPKISSVYELKKVKEIIESLDVDLKVGIALETPASIQLIKDFIDDGIDAVVFNGDTLTEYLLAVDKNNPETYKFYDDTNPALMYQLEYVIRVCNRKNIKTSFVGSATNKKEMINYLVKKNINTIIVAPEKVFSTSVLVNDAEEEFIRGTDKEIRQYERTREKDRQKKELSEFEAIKEEEIKKKIIEDSSLVLKKEEVDVADTAREIKKSENIEPRIDVSKDIKLIKKEKKEFLENNLNVEMSESLVIHPEDMSVEKPDNVEEAMKLIDEHNKNKVDIDDVALAMKEIDEHNNKKNKITANDSLPEFKSEKNIDLVDSNEKLEDVPEDLYEINKDLKEEKIMYDIELIESEKREYLENSSEDSQDSIKSKESNESSSQKKDVLGIF